MEELIGKSLLTKLGGPKKSTREILQDKDLGEFSRVFVALAVFAGAGAL